VLDNTEENAFLDQLGAAIRNLREEQGLSQNQFAKKCGVDRTYLLRAERGRNIGILYLKNICDGAGIDLAELFAFDSRKKTKAKKKPN
jgi:transcriptional regulator with XRE-family HTH domain